LRFREARAFFERFDFFPADFRRAFPRAFA
jgi:hypothetical protein